MVEKLKLVFAESPETNDHELRPFSGDVDILAVTPSGRYLGLDPPHFFRQPELIQGGQAMVGRCRCGAEGCDDCLIKVEVSGETVAWVFSLKKRFEFDRAQYVKTIQEGAEDTSWESVKRTVERLVGQLDFSARKSHGYRFDWASARIKHGIITLSFTKEEVQTLYEVAWNSTDPEDGVERVRQWLKADAEQLR